MTPDRPFALASDRQLKSERKAEKALGFMYTGACAASSLGAAAIGELLFLMYDRGMQLPSASIMPEACTTAFAAMMGYAAYLKFARVNRISREQWLRELRVSGQVSFTDVSQSEITHPLRHAQGISRPNFLQKALSALRRMLR